LRTRAACRLVQPTKPHSQGWLCCSFSDNTCADLFPYWTADAAGNSSMGLTVASATSLRCSAGLSASNSCRVSKLQKCSGAIVGAERALCLCGRRSASIQIQQRLRKYTGKPWQRCFSKFNAAPRRFVRARLATPAATCSATSNIARPFAGFSRRPDEHPSDVCLQEGTENCRKLRQPFL
jgi:hypothetical protein